MFIKPEECSKLLLRADSCWEQPRDRHGEPRSVGGLGDLAGDGCFMARHEHSPCVTPWLGAVLSSGTGRCGASIAHVPP